MTALPVQPRPRGRPNRISSDEILAAALAMLETDGLEHFSLTRLARHLGLSVMALYTYFPSRSALLDAVADMIFGQFVMPEKGTSWEEQLDNWSRALLDLFTRHPVGFKLVRFDRYISPSFWKLWSPIVLILRDAGLRGRDLHFAATWAGETITSIVSGHINRDEISAAAALTGSETLRRVHQDMLPDHNARLFDFGVQQVIAGVRVLLTQQTSKI